MVPVGEIYNTSYADGNRDVYDNFGTPYAKHSPFELEDKAIEQEWSDEALEYHVPFHHLVLQSQTFKLPSETSSDATGHHGNDKHIEHEAQVDS